MTFLVERLVRLRTLLDHLGRIRPRVTGPASLADDLSLQNDVVYSLFAIAQLVIDVAAELAARRGDRFEDYTEAVRSLQRDGRFPPEVVAGLVPLPGFRNVVAHEYVGIDFARVVTALDGLEPVRRFVAIVAEIESA